MKKLLIVVCAVALVFGSFSAVATAGANNVAEFCKSEWIPGIENWELFGFKNRGDCVSNFVPANFCKSESFIPGYEWWELLGFKNRGDCVSWFNQ